MSKKINFCDYCSGIVIKGDEVYHKVYCEKDVHESEYYNIYLKMNYYCFKYCFKYILMNGNLIKIKEIFTLFIMERLKEQNLEVEVTEKQDFLLFLNESKPPQNAPDFVHKRYSLKYNAKCEISLFNTIINNFFKNDNDLIKKKRTKITEEISQFLLMQFRKFYKFKFLSNKCPYCFKLTSNIFEHLFNIERHNFIKCISNLSNINEVKEFIFKELDLYVNVENKKIKKLIEPLFTEENMEELERKLVTKNCGLKIIGLEGNKYNVYAKDILNKFHTYFKDLSMLYACLILEIKEKTKKFVVS